MECKKSSNVPTRILKGNLSVSLNCYLSWVPSCSFFLDWDSGGPFMVIFLFVSFSFWILPFSCKVLYVWYQSNCNILEHYWEGGSDDRIWHLPKPAETHSEHENGKYLDLRDRSFMNLRRTAMVSCVSGERSKHSMLRRKAIKKKL